MKRYICSIITLFSALGLLINCNGAKRPWSSNQPGTGNETQGATTTTPGPANIGTPGKTQIVFSDVKPLFEQHCISCHVVFADDFPDDFPPINWLDYSTAKSYADDGSLYERIWTLRADEKKGMPQGGFDEDEISNEEGDRIRESIKNWIEGGALQ